MNITLQFFTKLFFGLSLALILVPQSFAASINFSTDKTAGTTDDTFQISLSVDGEVDGGQIGIQGLQNFTVVGQQSSMQTQIINGKVNSVQQKIISLQPKKAGNFTLTALAKEDGKVLKSDSISFTVQESLIQKTKNDLLQNTQPNNENDTQTNTTNNPDNTTVGKSTKNLLTAPPLETLKSPEIKNFPKVEHISFFNAMFWMEFFGIIFLIVGIFFLAFVGIKRREGKKHTHLS